MKPAEIMARAFCCPYEHCFSERKNKENPRDFAQPWSCCADLEKGKIAIAALNEAGLVIVPLSEPIGWLRDLDGTGSLHVCAKGDPGARPVYYREKADG